ncbi:MAG: hypothetical protein J2O48_10525 [Solirubrobacterales bacterium]|nr:hypothetical protein [Solirubrobacterales bacterium]
MRRHSAAWAARADGFAHDGRNADWLVDTAYFFWVHGVPESNTLCTAQLKPWETVRPRPGAAASTPPIRIATIAINPTYSIRS